MLCYTEMVGGIYCSQQMVCQAVWSVGQYGLSGSMVCRAVWYVGQYGLSDSMVCRAVVLSQASATVFKSSK